MQISLENIEEITNPYQRFLDSLKNPDVKRKYPKDLKRFLDLVPNEIYEKKLGKTPMCQEVGTLAVAFVDLAKKDTQITVNIISAYIKEENKLVKEGKIGANQVIQPFVLWVPNEKGQYYVEIFVWKSLDNPEALSVPLGFSIYVS